jgi:Zinc finger, ZZ type
MLETSSAPISKVIDYLPSDIPRILINRTVAHPALTASSGLNHENAVDNGRKKDFRQSYVFDAYLLGFCDDVVRSLSARLMSSPTSGSDESKSNCSASGRLLLSDGHTFGDGYDWLASEADDKNHLIAATRVYKVPPERVFLFPGAELSRVNGASTATTSIVFKDEPMAYNEIAHCDGCGILIERTIQKCTTCFDFDLCEACFPFHHLKHYGGTHVFAIEVPTRNDGP